MRVVIPVGDLHIGGGCKLLVQIANALVQKGHEVEVIIPQSGTTVKYALNCKLTKVPALDSSFIPQGDIILSNFYTTFRPAFEAWPQKCVRLSLGFEPLWVPDVTEALWSYSHNTPMITISSWLDNHIFNHTGKRGIIVSPGINLEIFSPGIKTQKKIKEIVYIARPSAGYALKGFDDFSSAVNIFRQKYPHPFLVKLICPEGPTHLPGIPHQVITPQTDYEMAMLYRSADLFVSSSWFEAFSLPPLEAMACGAPVVTTDQGGNMDYCKHMSNSYVTPSRNPGALAEGMLTMLTNLDLAESLRSNALITATEFPESRFAEGVISKLESIYASQ